MIQRFRLFLNRRFFPWMVEENPIPLIVLLELMWSNFSFALSCEGVSQKVVGAWRWIKVGHFSNSTSYCMNSVIFLRHTHELSRIGTTSCIRSLLLF